MLLYNDSAEIVELERLADGPAADLEAIVGLCWGLRQRDSRRALLLADRVDTILKKRNDRNVAALAARTALARAEVHALFNQYEEAERHLTLAQDGFASNEDPVGLGDTALVDALLGVMKGKRDRHVAAFARARKCFSRGDDALRESLTEVWQLLLTAFSSPGEAAQGLAQFVELHPAPLACSLSSLIAATRAQLAFSSEPARSAGLFLESSELAREAGMIRHAILMIGNAGAAFLALGDHRAASECFEAAVTRARETGWPSSMGMALMRLGELLRELGQLEASRAALDEAVIGFDGVPGGVNKATTFAGLAQTLLLMNIPNEAVSAFESAIALYRDAQSMDNLTFDLIGLGRALAASGRREAALAAFDEARTNIERFGFASMEVLLLEALADSRALHDATVAHPDAPDLSVYYLEEALKAGRRVAGWLAPAKLLLALADAWANAGDTARAFAYAKEALTAERREGTRQAVNQVAVLQVRHETEMARADALHHRNIAETLAETSRTLAQLGSIGQQITSNLNAGAIFEVLCSHLAALVQTDHVALWIRDESGDTLSMIKGVERGQAVEPGVVEWSAPDSPIACCARDNREVLQELDGASAAGESDQRGSRFLSAYYGPLSVHDRVIGVIAIRADRAAAFGERELLIFRTLCAYCAIALDNTSAYQRLEQAQEQLKEASLTDPLTGLRNRRYLEQHIHADVEVVLRQDHVTDHTTGSGVALLFFLVDLDHFKQVNDVYGHSAGDAVLVQMRDRLASVFRAADHLIRWGGEEFLIVARSSARRDAPLLAERLREAVAGQAFAIDGATSIMKTCSVGFAAYPFDIRAPRELTWQEIVNLADMALYAAKHAGRNCWVGLEATAATKTGLLTERMADGATGLVASGQVSVLSNRSDLRV